MNTPVIWLYIIVLFFVSIYDLKTRRIPDLANLLLLAMGIFFLTESASGNFVIWLQAIVITIFVFLVLLAFSVLTRGGLGGGDLKLATALTLPLGSEGISEVVLAWFWVGMAGIPIIFLALFRVIAWKSSIPFAPCLAVGYLVMLM